MEFDSGEEDDFGNRDDDADGADYEYDDVGTVSADASGERRWGSKKGGRKGWLRTFENWNRHGAR